MLRRKLLQAAMAVAPIRWLGPWIPSVHGAAAGSERNAADIYERAFAWSTALQSDDRDCLRHAATIALEDPQVDRLIERARSVLEAIREAAAVDNCRWKVERVRVEDLNKGHLDVWNRNLIHVACLSARRHARSGRGREALDDLFAGLTLAHRLGINGVLIARLFESAGETVAFETLGRILPELDRPTRDDLSRRLDALAPPEPPSATIGPESWHILDTLRATIMKLGPVIEGEEWAELGCGDDKPESQALKRLTRGDRARLLTHLDESRPAFDELARRLDLPRAECRRALDEFVQAEQSTHPIVAGFVPAAWGNRISVERQRILRVMVRAGLVLVESGEAAFRAVFDPSRPASFELERQGTTFMIRSAGHDDGMPEVTLPIG